MKPLCNVATYKDDNKMLNSKSMVACVTLMHHRSVLQVSKDT